MLKFVTFLTLLMAVSGLPARRDAVEDLKKRAQLAAPILGELRRVKDPSAKLSLTMSP
jgi:hypothetical protein